MADRCLDILSVVFDRTNSNPLRWFIFVATPLSVAGGKVEDRVGLVFGELAQEAADRDGGRQHISTQTSRVLPGGGDYLSGGERDSFTYF